MRDLGAVVDAELDRWLALPTERQDCHAVATLLLARAVLSVGVVAERLAHPTMTLPPAPDNWGVTAKGRAVWTGPLDADGHPMPEEGL